MKNNNDYKAKLAVNKSLLKEYKNSSNERIVYMNDGTEFQISIFNPHTFTIGVSFSFNTGSNLTYDCKNLLVIKPGQRVWLERYLNDSSKLLFSTYEVNNSEPVKKAIEENGKLLIKFFKEKTYEPQLYVWNPYTYNNTINYINSSISSSSDIYASDISTSVNCISTSASTLDPASVSASTSTLSLASAASTTELPKINVLRSKSIETGRIDKGSYSNQKFSNVCMDFESWPFDSEIIHILPSSQKPIIPSDLQKIYCTNCGRKLNNKYKFCPNCGTKIEKQNINKDDYVIIRCPYCKRRIRSNMMECPHCGEILK